MGNATTAEYKLELSNCARGHQHTGTFYGVGRYINGCRQGWALEPQESRERAENLARVAGLAAAMMEAR